MKAVQIKEYGGIDVLELSSDIQKPVSAKGYVLVEVYAASINPVDWKIRAGFFKEMAPIQFPATMGGDFAGVVAEVGGEVTEFKTDDEVYGSALVLNGGSGSFAELLSARVENTAFKPKSVHFIEAAALPLVGSSAIQALEEHITLQSRQKILIHGGAGGIGHVAIQLAKILGAYVTTTVSTNDMDFVKQLGADEVIDYKNQQFETVLKDFDAVFDTVGGEITNKSLDVLKRGGILVSMAGEPDKDEAEKRGITAISQFTQTNTNHLNRLTKLVDSGKVNVSVDKVFPLEEAKQAFSYQEEIHPKGKVVFKII
ncbi:MAG: hypothetical protein A2770_00530 [Candidatus Levybacteria bacterium RIFCSPHIGHO2_01_FULL_38_12]|nr:MAG: hypothetical protein A2770_00530 [Candidatus Levybacteria bacterium RIFCSPHIGHO2_01_FULL_38_12]OGH44989.1 MAG: hypothetical protein A3J14_03890 [Candidatus Levybacteria bacterium RIFCSPLOWO2_02_FULL_37_18]